jgi:hypothetical protein
MWAGMPARHSAEVLSCPNCAAPLEAVPPSGVVQCAYCGRTVNVFQEGPAPAPRGPVPSGVTTSGPLVAVLVSLGGAVLTVALVTGLVVTRRATRQAPTAARVDSSIPSRKLAELSMDRTAEQVAAWAGVKLDGPTARRVEVKLRDSAFARIACYWPAQYPTHIESIDLTARSPILPGDRVFQAADSVFGSRFGKDPSGGYAYVSGGVSFAVRGNVLQIRASSSAHPGWHRQIATLWEVARAIVLEQPVAVSAEARREWLGIGYPLRSLLAIDPRVDVDGSRAHLLGLFPGVSGSTETSNLRFTLPLDHPWFRDVSLEWENEKGGKLRSASFRPPAQGTEFPNQREIRDCLAKRLGQPEDRETNHLAGEHSYFWGKYWPRASLNLHKSGLYLSFDGSTGMGPITLRGVAGALDACVSGPR